MPKLLTAKPIEAKVETKSVKHIFNPEERNDLGSGLARCIAGLRGIEAENDQVKAAYKARMTEAEARIDMLSTNLMNGFEMRNERCVVVFRVADRKKDFHLEKDWLERNGESAPVLTEDMSGEDFNIELIQAESKFDNREEIGLFQPTENDHGILVVGRFADKWFSALRVKIGRLELTERLDSEQRCFKARPDAVQHAVKRVTEWTKEHMKEHSKGFEDQFKSVVEAHKERAE